MSICSRKSHKQHHHEVEKFIFKCLFDLPKKMSLTDEKTETSDFEKLSENNFQRLRNKITKVGYADGAADGREGVFQDAFDQGYKDGLRTAFEIDKFKYFFNELNDKTSPEDLIKEKEKYLSMDIKEAKDPEHFLYQNNKEENLNEISLKQQQHVDSLLTKFKAELPKVVDLLNTTKSFSQ
uniref:Yae1_N domain-containing protein n=1 Tax=Glossina brevipalpis TaxID=37001 RepID=A0A1A9W6I1_9MUSC